MYCRVAPIKRFPRSATPYDYKIPEDLTVAVGSFVVIPLRRSTTIGLVVELMEASAVPRVRDVLELSAIPALSKQDVHFYQALARRTYQSLGSILFAAIPPIPKRLVHKDRPPILAPSLSARPRDVKDAQQIVRHMLDTTHARVQAPNDKVMLVSVLGYMKVTQEPLLVLVPDVHLLETVVALAHGQTDSVKVLGSTQSKTEAWEAYRGLRDGTTRVTVATRMGALVPPHATTRIVCLAAGDDLFAQWDQNPHYDARWCLQARQDTHPNPTALLSTFVRIEDGELTLNTWHRPEVQIVNMTERVRTAEHYLLSAESVELIQTTDTSKAPLVVFYNRLDKQEHPDYVGAESLQTLLQRLRPGVTVTTLTTGDTMPKAGIVIATRALMYTWDYLSPTISGLIVLRPEHNLIYRGFRSLEQATRELRRLVSYADTAQAPCIIQAKEPLVVRDMLHSPSPIIQQERSLRKALGYPPYADLHVCRAKDDGSRQLVENYRAQHNAAPGTDLVVRCKPGESVDEWLTWPPSCDMVVSPDTLQLNDV